MLQASLVARTLKVPFSFWLQRSRLLDKALGPLSEPVPPKNAPKIGTRMVFPEDAFVADALNRFPLLQ